MVPCALADTQYAELPVSYHPWYTTRVYNCVIKIKKSNRILTQISSAKRSTSIISLKKNRFLNIIYNDFKLQILFEI